VRLTLAADHRVDSPRRMIHWACTTDQTLMLPADPARGLGLPPRQRTMKSQRAMIPIGELLSEFRVFSIVKHPVNH
jgi:hypothetical protein